MRSISIKEMPHDRRNGKPILELILDMDNVYIIDCHKDTWRIWIEFDGPRMELVSRG